MGGTIFAGSAIHGVYVTSNDGDTWNNYSNPFNPTTRITFGLKEPAAVSLRIYDAAGRLVRVLVAGSLPGGTYAELWDGTDSHGASVASGIYFYRLDAGSFTQTRKMVLLK
jgi:flagellar hook assembly protein FlgD